MSGYKRHYDIRSGDCLSIVLKTYQGYRQYDTKVVRVTNGYAYTDRAGGRFSMKTLDAAPEPYVNVMTVDSVNGLTPVRI